MAKEKEWDVRAVLREAGLRATPARMLVGKILRSSATPLTHAELAQQLEAQGIDRTTVFRNLNDLCEAGLVRKLEVGDHVYRFEWRDASQPDDEHAHFVCVECGEVQCLKNIALPPLPAARRRQEHIHDVTEVLYKGHCSECAD